MTEIFTDLDKQNWFLGSWHFQLLSQLPQKIMLASKEVKSDSKIIILLYQSKSDTLCRRDFVGLH